MQLYVYGSGYIVNEYICEMYCEIWENNDLGAVFRPWKGAIFGGLRLAAENRPK